MKTRRLFLKLAGLIGLGACVAPKLSANELHAAVSNKPLKLREIMFLPAGVQKITPTQNGRPVTVVVSINEQGAVEMQKQLEAAFASGNHPYIAFDEKYMPTAFWCKKFIWKPDGIYLQAEQVCEDSKLVGMALAATFFVNRISTDPQTPAFIEWFESPKPCFGRILPLQDCCFNLIKPILPLES